MENETQVIEDVKNLYDDYGMYLMTSKQIFTRLQRKYRREGKQDLFMRELLPVLKKAVEDGTINRKQLEFDSRKKREKLPDVFTVDQIRQLFENIDKAKISIACALAFFCGLRVAEVCKLKIEDIDFNNQRIKIVDSKNTNRFRQGYGKDRYVPLPPQMINPIKKWLDIIQGGKWFLPSDKSPDMHIRKKTLQEQFRLVLKKTGLLIDAYEVVMRQRIFGEIKDKRVVRHKYYFHTLRHSYATYLRDKGVDIYTISDLLGHNQVSTTQIYARISDTQRRKAVEYAFSGGVRNFAQKVQDYASDDPIEIARLELEKKRIELEKLKLMKEMRPEVFTSRFT